MKLFNPSILAILSFTNSMVYAACRATSPLGNPDLAKANIDLMCSKIAGQYDPNTGVGNCVDLGTISYRVKAFNVKGIQNTLDQKTCVQYLKDDVGCPKGGQSIWPTTGWRTFVEPMLEKCT
ncbi:hypothetical protein DSL72_001495 [Monilinia vaccinii-corymbosi]|uniref:Secreted protein n=1 Tax=Monilinia vaccinii-corymbosi TaxID=61207 RepID=A0A8A3P7H3_9HELO|nr:hypothetical protein DSL72_001495 [Monilinia vaccinii-corymbosi]